MSKRVLKGTIATILVLVITVSSALLVLYASEDLFIDHQYSSDVRDIPWGMYGDTGSNGCGWISVYNIVASRTERDITKEDLVQEVVGGLSDYGAPFVFGVLGSDPFTMNYYLGERFESSHISIFLRPLWPMFANSADGIIILYQHEEPLDPLHYVAGISTGELNEQGDKTFNFYNESRVDRYDEISAEEYLKILKEDGCKTFAMIFVKGKKGNW